MSAAVLETIGPAIVGRNVCLYLCFSVYYKCLVRVRVSVVWDMPKQIGEPFRLSPPFVPWLEARCWRFAPTQTIDGWN